MVDELTDTGVTVYFSSLESHVCERHHGSACGSNARHFGSFAKFERAIIRERQAKGIALAKRSVGQGFRQNS